MTEPFKFMAILAHPDDECMGMGTTFAKYAAEGIETHLVCATRGERGWTGLDEEDPGFKVMAEIRTKELIESARVLNISQVHFLNFIDGDLDQVRPGEAIARIVHLIRQVRPQVVATFSLDGAYGHPDHIAISQFTGAALICAADSSYPGQHSPHRVSKFYYLVDDLDIDKAYTRILGDITMEVDGIVRKNVAWPTWAVSACIGGGEYWKTAWRAVQCHASQIEDVEGWDQFTDQDLIDLLGHNPFLRVYSLVNGGRQTEDDLFCGLR